MTAMHILITGAPGAGKSTLIRRVLAELDRPVWGFETKKERGPAREGEGSPVYIHEVGKEQRHLAGFCENRQFEVRREVFDRFGAILRTPVPEGHLVLMDELGTMESGSEEFCAAVLALLDGDAPVIAAVKYKDTPFLYAVRTHPKGRCFHITEENREEVYREVLAILKEQPG